MNTNESAKKIKRWCPQPKAPIAANVSKLSVPIITILVITEIILLLVTPLAYFALLAPKPDIKFHDTYPLTDAQIRESWPNLPTAQQIIDSGTYGGIDTSSFVLLPNSTAHTLYYQSIPHWWQNASEVGTVVIENCTETNLLGIPIIYRIYLQTSNTSWIIVPEDALTNSSHPPTIPSDTNNGFLGTNMPTTYGLAAITIISITVIVGACYLMLIRQKMKQQPDFN